MAQHFAQKEDQTQEMPRTRIKRPVSTVPTREDGLYPYGQSASYRMRGTRAAVRHDYYVDDMPARGGIAMLGRGILLLLAWTVRLVALAGVCVVLINVIAPFVLEGYITMVMDRIWSFIPWGCIERLSVDTPFGGTFYGDLAIATLLLFIIDWLLCRARAALR